MTAMASQITSLTIFYWTVYSVAYQRKHQSSASLAFVQGIHRGPVNSPHKWPVTRKMFPFDDVIMSLSLWCQWNLYPRGLNDWHFAHTIFRQIFLKEKSTFWFQYSLKFVHSGQIGNKHDKSKSVQVKAWCTWWRHQMETFSALLAICARNSAVPGEFHAQRPVTRSFDVFFLSASE